MAPFFMKKYQKFNKNTCKISYKSIKNGAIFEIRSECGLLYAGYVFLDIKSLEKS